jgi:hypothetical protein
MDTTDASSRSWPSDEPIRHNGVTFDRHRCSRIRRIIRERPDITRVALAQRVCTMVGWQRFNGELPERSCRNLLDRLHKHGWIQLPPSRRQAKTAQPPPPAPSADSPLPAWPEIGPREDASCPLLVRPILAEEKAAFRLWIQRHHYLGYRPLVGESLCYAAFWEGHLVALLAWAAASLKNAPRDASIGWDEQTKRERLPFVVQNVRFVILPDIDAPAHLASRVLAANLRRLSRDWQACYRHPLLLAETFVDESRFQGTCYRAANWIRLGLTRGFGRHGSTYRHHGVPKAAWIYPLRADALSRLRNAGIAPTVFPKEDGMSKPALNRVLPVSVRRSVAGGDFLQAGRFFSRRGPRARGRAGVGDCRSPNSSVVRDWSGVVGGRARRPVCRAIPLRAGEKRLWAQPCGGGCRRSSKASKRRE